MKKKIFLVLGLFTMGLMSVAFVSTIETSNLSSLIANIEALADAEITAACKDVGGQHSRGKATPDSKTHSVEIDVNGNASYGGATESFGVALAGSNVNALCTWVKCKGNEGGCIVCNMSCKFK